MASDKYIETHREAEKLIKDNKLHDAFSLLKGNPGVNSSPKILDKIHKTEETYRYLLHYMMEGVDDSGRERMLSDIKSRLLQLNDTILRQYLMTDNSGLYYSTRRFEDIRKTSLHSHLDKVRNAALPLSLADPDSDISDLRREYESALSELFGYIWTMFGSPAADYKTLEEIVNDDSKPFDLRTQIISALLLGNLQFYDPEAFNTLISIYEKDSDEKISARALVAIFLIISTHPERIRDEKRFEDRLSLWQDSIINYRRLREVLINAIRTKDTQRISTKVKDELLPELMRLKPDIINKLKDASRDADLDMLDVNPEWEDILNKNGLGDKLKELTEMQMEGGDVMMVAFSNLKNFPFFNTIGNWFLPFSPRHSEVTGGSSGIGAFSEMLEMEGVMCDSDKYSFALSLTRMPEAQRKMMTANMDSQMAQLREMTAERKQKSTIPTFDLEVTRYMRDLYRFFKLFRKKEEFPDPFLNPIDFTTLPYISDILSDIEIVNIVGEFYFKRGYYAEALPMLTLSAQSSDDSHLFWEKIGYCHNALKNLKEAVAWYKKAELMNPDSLWLMKKLAVCYRMLGRYPDAAEYYGKALETDPDNYNLLMSAGHCLLESGDTEGALSKFHHADYVKPDKVPTWRAIGWSALSAGDLEKSEKFFMKIIESGDATANDLINAGHIHYLKGDLRKAADFYRKSTISSDGSIRLLENTIKADIPVIEKAGGKASDLRLILENVAYDKD